MGESAVRSAWLGVATPSSAGNMMSSFGEIGNGDETDRNERAYTIRTQKTSEITTRPVKALLSRSSPRWGID